jgi:hypothetical protein
MQRLYPGVYLLPSITSTSRATYFPMVDADDGVVEGTGVFDAGFA